jgi:hypothetical protein
MRAGRAISLTPLRPNGGQARAKPRQETGLFDRVSSKLKYLHVIFAHLSGLRRRCDEPKANWWHPVLRLKPHGAAFGFLSGDPMASDRFAALTGAMKLRKIFRGEAVSR